MVGPGRPVFVLFGSSIVQFSYSNGGWGAILADVYARKVLVAMPNDAIPSLPPMPKSSNDLLIFFCVDILVGTQDVLSKSLTKFFQSSALSELVRTNERCQRYSEACVELCKEMDVKVVDLYNAIQKGDDWKLHCSDGIHLSSEGSKIVVEEIIKVIKEAEWEPSLHWKSLPTEFAEDSPYDVVASDGMSTINISNCTFHREMQWD
ncbi:hypothetical protein B296_00034697 [Ensete ventricosum]|uniref:SGNH hydrolase-type esterase domain-containing protein n=1 Tax=Ensete ventricosum TaxID=4639 RepID=A0A426XNX0_ENSVE|nr:hypothetical protein B296_00034697 [Ensete ventricosum]